MTPTQQNQLAGIGLIIGGAYGAIWGMGHVIPAVLLTAGLIWLNRQQKSGVLGRIGMIILGAGLGAAAAVDLLTYVLPTTLAPAGVMPYIASGLVISVGMVIFGIAAIRAGRFRGGELLVVGPLSTVLMGTWGAKLGALGFVVLGYFLVTATVAPPKQLTPIG